MMTRSVMAVLILCGSVWSAPVPLPSAPSGGGAGSAPASIAEASTRADVLLNEAEVWVSDLEKTVKGGANGSGCPPNFSIRSYLRDVREKKVEKELGKIISDAGAAEWGFGLVCRAIAAKSVAPCADGADILRSAKGQDGSSADANSAHSLSYEFATEKDRCVDNYPIVRTKIAYVAHDPNFMAICRGISTATLPMKSPAAQDAICAAWQSTSQDTSALAAALSNGARSPIKPEYARITAREIISEPAVCANATGDQAVECREIGDYRAALAKKSAAACRGGLCRMLMGGRASDCDSYDTKLASHVCSSHYRAKFSAERAPLVTERLKLAEALIVSISARVTDLREAQTFTDRLDRVYALRDRLARATSVLEKTAASGGKAPVKGPRKNTK